MDFEVPRVDDGALKAECIKLIQSNTNLIPAIKHARAVKRCTLQEALTWVRGLGVNPPDEFELSRFDPVTALVALRAEMVRLAHEVEALTDERGIVDVRKRAPVIANRLRDAAMRRDMVEASKR